MSKLKNQLDLLNQTTMFSAINKLIETNESLMLFLEQSNVDESQEDLLKLRIEQLQKRLESYQGCNIDSNLHQLRTQIKLKTQETEKQKRQVLIKLEAFKLEKEIKTRQLNTEIKTNKELLDVLHKEIAAQQLINKSLRDKNSELMEELTVHSVNRRLPLEKSQLAKLLAINKHFDSLVAVGKFAHPSGMTFTPKEEVKSVKNPPPKIVQEKKKRRGRKKKEVYINDYSDNDSVTESVKDYSENDFDSSIIVEEEEYISSSDYE